MKLVYDTKTKVGKIVSNGNEIGYFTQTADGRWAVTILYKAATILPTRDKIEPWVKKQLFGDGS